MAKTKKPKKPYPDFPLFAHAVGQWAKKIRGKMHYFGTWGDPEAALKKYTEERDDLQAGRTPRLHPDALTIRDLANRFLTAKLAQQSTGELSPHTFRSYHTACDRVLDAIGGNIVVAALTPADFAKLRGVLAETMGPVSLGVEIQRIRTVFKFALDNELIDRPVRFGTSFEKPSRKAVRQARAAAGPRMFEPKELRKILAAAGPTMKAMVLLGLNCGYGQSDVSALPKAALDLRGGWVNFPRPKTGIARRCPLWPEAVKALKRAIAERPEAKDAADEGLVFLTCFGVRWVRARERPPEETADGIKLPRSATGIDSVNLEFNKLLKSVGLKKTGIAFYTLRHVFRTVADGAKDQPAVNSIMGHADESMAAAYRERIEDERLKAVTDHVRNWLLTK
jgi:integrase